MFASGAIKKKFQDQCTGPFTLTAHSGSQAWHVLEDNTGKKFILHSRRLRKFDLDDGGEPVEKPPPGSPVQLPPPRSPVQLPPLLPLTSPLPAENLQPSTRPRPEDRFLHNLHGSVSLTGRVRKGSMYTKV